MAMATSSGEKVNFDQFKEQWLAEIEDNSLSPLDKGRLFASNLITQWLGVTTEDDNFIVLDGSGDGGIDIAYLKQSDIDTAKPDDSALEEGDTWYLVQSKYGTAYAGESTIFEEGNKVITTLQGQNQHLAEGTRQLLQKLDLFRKQASSNDRIALVIATIDPIKQEHRSALDRIKLLGRELITPQFDVQEVSLATIWEDLEESEQPRLSVPVKGRFVEQSSGFLVGTVSLLDMFEFLQSFNRQSGNPDQLYSKNVRQFLGSGRKINKGIADTLNRYPEKFGLYNNGITIVVSGYSKLSEEVVQMNDPYVVNGCQTTRTIWRVLDSKLNAGGTGEDSAFNKWKQQASRGGVVAKIVSSDETEIARITRYTNSQNSVREQDFNALSSSFQHWAAAMARDYQIFLEIQRGGVAAQKAYEKQQHPGQPQYQDYVNSFDLIKVYGAGWLGVPGLAFGKNAPFLLNGSVYERIVSRQDGQNFGASDLYAAYKIKCAADKIGFGRSADRPSRRQSRFLFYHIIMRILSNILLLTPQFSPPPVSESALTKAVLKIFDSGKEEYAIILCNAAVALLDQYLTVGNPQSAHNEKSFREAHNGDLGAFLKAERLGQDNHSPLLVQLLAMQNNAFASMPMPMYEGNPTQKDFIARALLDN